MARMLITGASRSLGNLLQFKLKKKKDMLYLNWYPRSKSQWPEDGVQRQWIKADLSKETISKRIQHAPLDELIDIF